MCLNKCQGSFIMAAQWFLFINFPSSCVMVQNIMIIHGTKDESGIAGSRTSNHFFLTVFDVIHLMVSMIQYLLMLHASLPSMFLHFFTSSQTKTKKAVTMGQMVATFSSLAVSAPPMNGNQTLPVPPLLTVHQFIRIDHAFLSSKQFAQWLTSFIDHEYFQHLNSMSATNLLLKLIDGHQILVMPSWLTGHQTIRVRVVCSHGQNCLHDVEFVSLTASSLAGAFVGFEKSPSWALLPPSHW